MIAIATIYEQKQNKNDDDNDNVRNMFNTNNKNSIFNIYIFKSRIQ